MKVSVLDACVLVPITLTDTLLRLAEKGLFQPIWSLKIEQETIKQLSALYPSISKEMFKYRFQEMNSAFPKARVRSSMELSPRTIAELRDKNDTHVFETAMSASADSVITMNLKDFPAKLTEPLGFIAIHPDQFLLQLLCDFQVEVISSIDQQIEESAKPRILHEQLIHALSIQVPNFATEISRIYASTRSLK